MPLFVYEIKKIPWINRYSRIQPQVTRFSAKIFTGGTVITSERVYINKHNAERCESKSLWSKWSSLLCLDHDGGLKWSNGQWIKANNFPCLKWNVYFQYRLFPGVSVHFLSNFDHVQHTRVIMVLLQPPPAEFVNYIKFMITNIEFDSRSCIKGSCLF